MVVLHPIATALFQGFNMEDLIDSFRIMGQGMAGIFVVLILIALIVSLLSKITNPKKRKEKSDDIES